MEIKYLHESDILKVIELQTVVFNYLDNKSRLETLTVKEFENVLRGDFAIGIYEGETLIAFRTFLVPDIDGEEHLADDIPVQKGMSIYSELSLVHPDYRGQGIQTRMGAYLINELKASKSYRYVLATVAPDNIASLKDKFKLGFKIYKTKHKYGGKLRHILMLDLADEDHRHNEVIRVSYKDTDWMIANGKHYVGFAIENGEIHYYKTN